MKKNKCCNEARVIQVIETTIPCGIGDADDPQRLVTQYWSLDGKLLAKNDPLDNDSQMNHD